MEFVFHPKCLEHDTGIHPENAERLKWVLKEGYVKPESGREHLETVHSKEYIQKVRKYCERGWPLDPDTPTSPKSFEAACYAVGGAVKASEINGFALVRPPGHHAPLGGFCLFNNMVVACKKLVGEGKKVLIVDWDVHHGNGTQKLVFGEKKIHYFSVHEHPFYPGTGARSEGNCTNVPLPWGVGDDVFLDGVEKHLPGLIKNFDPDVIGVSAGFDSMREDSLAGLNLTDESYLRICELIGDREVFLVLEGGYVPSLLEKTVKRVRDFFC